MKGLVLTVFLIFTMALPVSAADITAPAVPDSGAQVMPADTSSFGEALLELISSAFDNMRPDLKEAKRTCMGIIGIVLLLSLIQSIPGCSQRVSDLVGGVAIGVILLKQTNSMIHLGSETIQDMSNYGTLLLPVMTAAMAAQGGITGSVSLYAGTALFDSILSKLISTLLIPMIYLLLALCVTNASVGEDVLKQLRDFVKWLMTWVLKIILYVFTGYMGITGVVSGTTDAATLKAAKLTISGMVPVVGSILSDASDAVLTGAAVVKNSAGIYGLLAILAVCIGPFLRIGTHYLMLKATAAVSGVFGSKSVSGLVKDFSTAMGLLLAMTGSVCLLLLISVVCFMKGVG